MGNVSKYAVTKNRLSTPADMVIFLSTSGFEWNMSDSSDKGLGAVVFYKDEPPVLFAEECEGEDKAYELAAFEKDLLKYLIGKYDIFHTVRRIDVIIENLYGHRRDTEFSAVGKKLYAENGIWIQHYEKTLPEYMNMKLLDLETYKDLNPEQAYLLFAALIAGEQENGGLDKEQAGAFLKKLAETKEVVSDFKEKTYYETGLISHYIFKHLEACEAASKNIAYLVALLASFAYQQKGFLYDELGITDDMAAKNRVSYFRGRLRKLFENDKINISAETLIKLVNRKLSQFTDIKDGEKVLRLFIFEFFEEIADGKKCEDAAWFEIVQRILNPKLWNIVMEFDAIDLEPSKALVEYLVRNEKVLLDKEKEAEDSYQRFHNANVYQLITASAEIEEMLRRRVKGQDSAVSQLVSGIRQAFIAGERGKNKPLATFLFAGPPGVGKSYLAKCIADQLGVASKVFDMSGYVDDEHVHNLTGFAPSYKAAQEGVLTGFVKEHPCSVIIIDEIEKAHKAVQLMFLQVLEGGVLRDKFLVEDVDFTRTIMVFTTNCGKELYENNYGQNLSLLTEYEIRESLRADRSFPQELISRFASGNLIMFNFISMGTMLELVDAQFQNALDEIKMKYKGYISEISLDQFLEVLYLAHESNAGDARVITGKSGAWLREEVLRSIQNTRLPRPEVHFVVEASEANERVRQFLTEHEKQSSVLVFGDLPKGCEDREEVTFTAVKNVADLPQLLREKRFDAVVVDLEFGISEAEAKKLASAEAGLCPLDYNSAGREALEVIVKLNEHPPIYVFGWENASKRKIELQRLGVVETLPRVRFAYMIRLRLRRRYQIQNLEKLAKNHQRIDYRIRYYDTKKSHVIELYQLQLVDVEPSTIEMRRFAQENKVENRPTVKFADIIGAENAKHHLQQFVRYIEHAKEYRMRGVKVPKGVLLYGAPGTGKTSLAKALAAESNAAYYQVTGTGLRNAANPIEEIKLLFETAANTGPSIIFIDEVDAIAENREHASEGMHMLVNTMLTQMDGFGERNPDKPVFVVAATNAMSDSGAGMQLDVAFMRRFSHVVEVELPNEKEREAIIRMYLDKMKCRGKITEEAVRLTAKRTAGESPAYLERIINNMVIDAVERNIECDDELLNEILEEDMFGQTHEVKQDYLKAVARHEAGHAYVEWRQGRTPEMITITARGGHYGYIHPAPYSENSTKQDYTNLICTALAGRAAEIHYYGEAGINTGASSDLRKATNCAMTMVCSLGMGKTGLLSLEPSAIAQSERYNEVLEEAEAILQEQMERTKKYIREGEAQIDRIVEVLLKKNFIQKQELEEILPKQAKWYYAVRKGRTPGVYKSWEECKAQVTGYSGAVYKKFDTEQEAVDFIKHVE